MLATVGLLALMLGVLPATPALAAAGSLSLSVTITDTNGNPITSVDASAGPTTAYRVNIAYGCNGSDCTNSKVVVASTPLDPYYHLNRKEENYTYIPPFTPAPALTGSLAAGLTVNLGTVTAGTNGLIRFDYLVGQESSVIGGGNWFPDGSPIKPDVTISATNATSVQGSATATWKSQIATPNLSMTTTPATRVNTDTQLTVTPVSNSGCWHNVNGVLRSLPYRLCGDSGQISVTLPAKAQYVPGSGGTYDPASNTVTVTSGPKAWQLIGGSFKVTFPSSAYPTSGTGCVVPETFTAFNGSYTYLDGTIKATSPATSQVTVTVGNCAPFAKGAMSKASRIGSAQFTSTSWSIPATSAAEYSVRWEVNASNQSNVDGVATITDNGLDQPGLPVNAIQVGAGGPATITYTLDDGTTATLTNATKYTAPTGRRITAATLTSSVLAGPNVTSAGTAATPFIVYFGATVKAGATPGDRTNTATSTLSFPDNPELGTIRPTGSPVSRTVTLYVPGTPFTLNAGGAGVTVTGGGTALVGGEVVWNMISTATNVTAANAWTPQEIFLAPLGWNIKANGATLSTSVPGATFTYTTVTYLGNSYDAVIVNWPAATTSTGTVTLPTLSVKTTPTGAAVAGTNNQISYSFLGDVGNGLADAYNTNKVTDTSDIDLDGVSTDVFAQSLTKTSLAASPGIGVTKEICKPDATSSDGCNWISDPNVRVGVSPSSTSIKYRVTIKNTGNAPLSSAVAYDVLPFIGDTGTTTDTAGTPRGSTVQEQLAGVSNVSSGVTLAYSASTNPPRPEVYTGTDTTGTWTAPVVGASAIQATVGSLAPGASVAFQYVGSLVGGSADQVACNSVAVASGLLTPVEPTPVCATTQEADFSLVAADHLPLQDERVGVVPFTVNNGGGSQSATGTVTISVPVDVDVVSLSPAGWKCTASSMTGPVDVTCIPVKSDGTTRSLEKNVPETIALAVKPTDDAPAQVCFPASIAGLMNDPDLTNNDDESCSTALSAQPQLLVSKDDGMTAVAVGDTATYTITATSRLVAEAINGVTVTDTLPAGLAFVSADPAPTSQSGQTLTWNLGTLQQAGIAGNGGDLTSGGPGSAKSITLTVRVKPGTQDSVTNTATASGADPADASISLIAQNGDTDTVLNVFTDGNPHEVTPQNQPVTTPLAAIVSTSGAPLDSTAVTQSVAPAHGSISIDPATGAVTYNPAPGYSGPDSYQVQVCDTSSPVQCHVSTVTVTVGVNVVDAVDDTANTAAVTPVTTDVRSNDTSQSDQPLGLPAVTSAPAHGTTTGNDDGTITYTPTAGFSGVDTYGYKVCDTSNPTPVCDTATVTVTVTNVFVDGNPTVPTAQNVPVTVPLADIVTTKGLPLDPAKTAEKTAPAHGAIAIDPITGGVAYTPSPGYTGDDSFVITVCDTANVCHDSPVSVTVGANVVDAVDDSASTATGVAVTTDVRGNDTSASGQPLADPTIETDGGHGVATVDADGKITYTPNDQWSGVDSYVYQVCDTSTPTPVCDTATVTVTVPNEFTDADPIVPTPHDTPVTTNLADIVSVTGAAVDPASVTQQTAPQHGTIAIDPDTGAVTYTPTDTYTGPDAYQVQVCDTSTPTPACHTSEVRITVGANTVTAVDDSDATAPATAVVTDVLANDTTGSAATPLEPASVEVPADPDHGTTSVDPATGKITYTPGANWSGVDTYLYVVCDTSTPAPVCDTATVTVTVDNVFTDGPAADGITTAQNAPITVPLTDVVNAEGALVDPAAVTLTTQPGHGSVSIDPDTGAVTYSPVAGYSGPDSFELQVCDASTPDPQCHAVTIPVTVQDNAVTVADFDITTRTNTDADPVDVLSKATSLSKQPLNPPTIADAPAHGTATVNPDGTITFSPAKDFDGDDSFTYTVCDTGSPKQACATGTINVTVTPVANLSTTKTLDTATIVAGLPVQYTTTVNNLGPSTATNVHSVDPIKNIVTDPLGTPDGSVPDGTCVTRPSTQDDLDRLNPDFGPYTLADYPNVVDCTYPAIPAGTSIHDTITGTVDPAALPGGDLVNQAPVFADTYDPDLSDNLGSATGTITASADLELTKRAKTSHATVGDQVTFTLTVVNHGPSVATTVVVTDKPTGMTFVSAKPGQGTFDGSSGTWTIGTLAVGQTVTADVVEKITATDAHNVADIASATPDPASTNNGGRDCRSGTTGCGYVGLDVESASANGGGTPVTGGSSGGTASTGTDSARLVELALLLLLAGGGALMLARRRRNS